MRLNLHTLFILTLLIWATPFVSAQMVVDQTRTPSDLVNNVLMGNGLTASNVTFNGTSGLVNSNQIGFFNGTSSNIGLNSGILITTGYAEVALSPNNSTNKSLGSGGTGTDPDLSSDASPARFFDQGVLEFDFVASGDSVSFTFVFASEEYNEYVCSSFNDIFGFYLSGAGITGPYQNNAANLAIIPGSNQRIAINSVNNGSVGSSGSYGNCGAAGLANASYFVDNEYNSDPTATQFDGFTVPVKVGAPTVCGATYHFKLAIADVSDGNYDSGVFVKAQSFTTKTTTKIIAEVLANDTIVNEGCDSVSILFYRADESTHAITVPVVTAGNAIENVDYETLPDSISFNANEDSLLVTVAVYSDAIVEGNEDVLIYVMNSSVCGSYDTTQTSFVITEAQQLNVTVDDQSIECAGSQIILLANTNGGLGNYNYLWNTGAITQAISVSPNVTTEYSVSVFETCTQQTANDTAIVTVQTHAPLTISNPTDYSVDCPGSDVTINSNVQGGAMPYTYAWIQNNTTINTTSTLNLVVNENTTVQLQVTDNCGNVVTQQFNLNITQHVAPIITIVSNGTNYEGCSSVKVQVERFNNVNTVDTLTLTYSGSATLNSDYTNALPQLIFAAGENVKEFNIDLLKDNTFESIETIEIVVAQYISTCDMFLTDNASTSIFNVEPLSSTLNDVHVMCEGETVELMPSVNGGLGVYTFKWNDGSTDNKLSFIANETKLVWYTVYEACNNDSITDTVTVTVNKFDELEVEILEIPETVCENITIDLKVNTQKGSGNYTYKWFKNQTVVSTQSNYAVAVSEKSTFIVEVTDMCNNKAFDTVVVDVIETIPMVIRNNDIHLCKGEQANLVADIEGGNLPVYSFWTRNSDTTQGGFSTQNMILNPDESSEITLVAMDACGQKVSKTVNLEVSQVKADFNYDVSGLNTVELNNTSSVEAVDFLWKFSDGEIDTDKHTIHNFNNLDENSVTLYVSDVHGCIDSTTQDIKAPAILYVPNAFTPNNDGHNDAFGAVGQEITDFEMIIFNRWGHVVFKCNNINHFWDGTFKGDNAQPSVYVYQIKAVTKRSARTIVKEGTVHLIR